MPKIVQPARLQRIAFESLITHVVNCCDEHSVKGCLTKLRGSVAYIKENIRDQLSGIPYAEFCRRFLDRFYKIGVNSLNERHTSHCRAVLEIMMDAEITGLICSGRIMHYLEPRDAHRLQRLEILDWSELQFCEIKPRGLENFRLENLTTFVFPRLCTDRDLEIIGSHCLKLQILMIQESLKVTDRGLQSLGLCSELRVMNLHYCRVTNGGINKLLTLHDKLEEFNIARYYLKGERSFDVLSRSRSLVCPSLKRFCIQSAPVTNEQLRSVVALFPNLNHLRICCQLQGDLSVLGGLDKLTELNFSSGYRCCSIENLKQLLRNIGGNISLLNMLHCNPQVCLTQDDLNFIHQFCGNVRSLGFDYEPMEDFDTMVVPSFCRLKKLECSTFTPHRDSCVLLEFDKLLALEDLKIHGFAVNAYKVESLMLDNTKFPNLKVLLIPYASERDVNHIMQIARENNLDFVFKNSFWEHII